MLTVWNNLEFELHRVGDAIRKRRFTRLSNKLVCLVDLLKNALKLSSALKNALHSGTHFAECKSTKFSLWA